MDKPYSFQYFNLVETIRDIDSRIIEIKKLEDRIGLDNE
jgi:predicted RNase H-like nuclease